MINANYILSQLRGYYTLPYDRICMHEVVLSATNLKRENGVRALDVAKRLIDYGIHPPTMYFPLIVDEALMIEPTETESKETLDVFIEVMKTIAEEASADPDLLRARRTIHQIPGSTRSEPRGGQTSGGGGRGCRRRFSNCNEEPSCLEILFLVWLFKLVLCSHGRQCQQGKMNNKKCS